MSKRGPVGITLVLFLLASWGVPFPAEKIKFASAVKVNPGYYLPIVAAEKQGYWKENGLEAEWIPFQGGGAMMKAVAGASISLGAEFADALIHAMASGIPIFIVADLQRENQFAIFALSQSPLKEPRQLKGTKIGVVSMGVGAYQYAYMIAAKLGLEKEIRFVALGGVPQTLAGVRAGIVHTGTLAFTSYVTLLVKGEVKEIACFSDYVTEERLAQVVYARKDLAKRQPQVVRAAVKALVEGSRFIRKNRAWALNEMKVQTAFPEAAGAIVYDRLKFTETGKIDPRALENVKRSLIDFGLVPADKAPATEELFTQEFTG